MLNNEYIMSARKNVLVQLNNNELRALKKIEDKLDKVLSLLNLLKNGVNTGFVASTTSQTSFISPEDQREIDELRRLSEGGSNEWDD